MNDTCNLTDGQTVEVNIEPVQCFLSEAWIRYISVDDVLFYFTVEDRMGEECTC